MNAHTSPKAAIEMPVEIAFDALSDREAIRLYARMGHRFSGCGYAYDRLASGIRACAAALAEDEGWRPDALCLDDHGNLADRYLADPARTAATPMVALSGAAFHGRRFGG